MSPKKIFKFEDWRAEKQSLVNSIANEAESTCKTLIESDELLKRHTDVLDRIHYNCQKLVKEEKSEVIRWSKKLRDLIDNIAVHYPLVKNVKMEAEDLNCKCGHLLQFIADIKYVYESIRQKDKLASGFLIEIEVEEKIAKSCQLVMMKLTQDVLYVEFDLDDMKKVCMQRLLRSELCEETRNMLEKPADSANAQKRRKGVAIEVWSECNEELYFQIVDRLEHLKVFMHESRNNIKCYETEMKNVIQSSASQLEALEHNLTETVIQFERLIPFIQEDLCKLAEKLAQFSDAKQANLHSQKMYHGSVGLLSNPAATDTIREPLRYNLVDSVAKLRIAYEKLDDQHNVMKTHYQNNSIHFETIVKDLKETQESLKVIDRVKEKRRSASRIWGADCSV